jgi:hypothetical protein
MSVTLEQVLGYITDQASSNDLDAVRAVVESRREVLAAAIREDQTVRLHNLKPKYFNDLTGTVRSVNRQAQGRMHAEVLLDEKSSDLLRFSRHGHGKGRVDPETGRIVIGGIPVICLQVIDQ